MAEKTGKQLIDEDQWAECWICKTAFARKRETKRYCHDCERGFCEGEHGNFSHGIGKCVICGAKKADKK